ncbi:hypothetical protein B0H14DRAFT_3743101 [Mycena olivaceomarginata]|nr:hypothetical protein B0H14DRAFT_3743101 [Mycena olivaceomarginata]
MEQLNRRGVCPTRLYLDCYHIFKLLPHGTPAFASSLVHLDIQLGHNHIALDCIAYYVSGHPADVDDVGPPSGTLPPLLHTLHVDGAHPLITDWIMSLDPVPTQITTLCLFHIDQPKPPLHPQGMIREWPDVNRVLNSPAAASLHSLILDHRGTLVLDINSPLAHRVHKEFCPDLESCRRVKHLKNDLRAERWRQISLRFSEPELNWPTWLVVNEALSDDTTWARLRRITFLADGLERSLGILAHSS